MDEMPLGVIEIILAFGLILALAIWELVRNRRALARLRADGGSNGPTREGRRPKSD